MTKDGVFWGTLFIFGVGVNITMVGFTIKCVDWTGINWDLGENVRPLFDSSFIFWGVCFGDSNKIYNYRIIMVYTDNYMIFGCAQRSKTWGYGIPFKWVYIYIYYRKWWTLINQCTYGPYYHIFRCHMFNLLYGTL